MLNGSQDFWCGDAGVEAWSPNPDDAKHYYESEADKVAAQLRCEYEEAPGPQARTNGFEVIMFILIQDDVVLDRARAPDALDLSSLDPFAGFKIAIGKVGKAGKREVAGVVADVSPLSDAATWRISSPMDGMYRLIGAAGCPAELVTHRLRVMAGDRQFHNLEQLPTRVVLTENVGQGWLSASKVSKVAGAIVPR
jgi:hypothetical protein